MAYGGDPQDNPYAAPDAETAPLSPAGPPRVFAGYAGFWLRLVAHFIDGIIVGIAFFAVVVVFWLMAGLADAAQGPPPQPGRPQQLTPLLAIAVIVLNGLWIIAAIAYYAVMESSQYQATLGKMALGLKVVDMQGRRISLGRAVGRLFAKILSTIPCDIGFIMAAFTEKKQALHDMIAGTLVVRS